MCIPGSYTRARLESGPLKERGNNKSISPKWRMRENPGRSKMVAVVDNKVKVVGGVFTMLPANITRPTDGL